ncbi:MAG: twin-arginine translocase TatA/TatE family subunit [Planctomycetes bacterium]|nr:twin-arginine translocase TatA/TatE family subunit [Planctomycetota bacterium]
MGFWELVMIGLVALIVYGGEFPQVLRTLGRAYINIKSKFQQLRDEIVSDIDIQQEEPKLNNKK